jgi:hypothetical protein
MFFQRTEAAARGRDFGGPGATRGRSLMDKHGCMI